MPDIVNPDTPPRISETEVWWRVHCHAKYSFLVFRMPVMTYEIDFYNHEWALTLNLKNRSRPRFLPFPESIAYVLASYCCFSNLPQTGQLQTTQRYSLTFLEVKVSGLGGQCGVPAGGSRGELVSLSFSVARGRRPFLVPWRI